MTIKLYAERDAMELDKAGGYYCKHVSAMTRENLHSKGDIAAELAWRDMQIDALKKERDALAVEGSYFRGEIEQHSNSTHFCEKCGEADPCINDDVCWSLNHPTPATDAAIANIQAQGVDKFADDCESDVVFVEPEDTEHYELMAEHARQFAAELRKEAENVQDYL